MSAATIPVDVNIELSRERREALVSVLLEANRADAKFGLEDHGDLVWLAVLTEEVGEVAEAILRCRAMVRDGKAREVDGSYSLLDIGTEIAQCGAVCLRWLEARERACGGASDA